MKWIVLVLLLAGAMLAAGCTSPVPPVATPVTTTAAPTAPGTAPVAAVPDLLGTWNGISTGYVDHSGYVAFNDTLVLNVVSQDGNLFKGELSFRDLNGTRTTKEFAGVVDADGKTFRIIEYPGGFSNGVILAADEIELVFRDEVTPSTISLDSLKRGTAAPEASKAMLPVLPDLRGTWNGTSLGFVDQSGYHLVHSALSMEVTVQDGRLFSGTIAYVVNGTGTTKEFAGVLGADGKTIETLELPDGFCDGVVVSADELELIFRDDVEPTWIAIDSFRRSTAPPTPAGKPTINLIGNWAGTSTGYIWKASGYEVHRDIITMRITDQDDRFFKGEVSLMMNGTMVTRDIAGVFTRDGKTVETIEFPDGFSDGTIVTADEIWFVFRDTSDPSRIAIDSFRRVT